MSTKAENSKPKETPEQMAPPPPPPFSILFQLEDIGVDGRKAAFDVLKKVLKDQKIELTPPMFSHYCLHSIPAVYLPQMAEALGAGRTPVEKLVEDVNSAISEHLAGNGIRLNAALGKILDAARGYNISAGAITALPESAAQAVAARLGLDALGIPLLPSGSVTGHFPGADTWLKAARAMSQRPHHCAVIAGNMAACKSALSADMHCVAVPDEFTAFQDFGGVDMILEKLDAVSPRELLQTLFNVSK